MGIAWCTKHPPFSDVQCELDHDNEVKCMDLNDDVSKVASGTIDGETSASFSVLSTWE